MTATTALVPSTSRTALSVEIDGAVAVVTFDLPNDAVNKFTRTVREEFAALLERVEGDPAIRAVVLLSGKPDVFIAGADIDELMAIQTPGEAERLSAEGQAMLDRMERGKPV